MSRFVAKFFIGLAVCLLNQTFLCAQSDSRGSVELRGDRPLRMIQSAADIAALQSRSGQAGSVQARPSQWNEVDAATTNSVRAGFTPTPQSASVPNSQSTNQTAGQFNSPQNDVYPYPASNQPRTGAASQSAYALSQGSGNGRLAGQISVGSNTSTGNLGDSQFSGADRYAANQAYWRSAAGQAQAAQLNQTAANSRAAVEQQRSSTLSAAQQASLNQAAVNRLRSQQFAAQNSQPRVAQVAQRTAVTNTQTNVGSNPRSNQIRYQQPTTAYRQTAYQAPVARVAQNCCQPIANPTTAGFQAAFQAPAINPNVGQGLTVPPLNIQAQGQVAQFQQPAFNNQFAQQQAACCGGYQYGNQFGNIGTPQFGAQGARWWTPFVTGSGVYQPLLNIVQPNPGTYLGQGIIGQPTAYVNGQPIRNLLRYVAP